MFKKTTLFVLFGFFLLALCATPQHAARANAVTAEMAAFIENCENSQDEAALGAATTKSKAALEAQAKIQPLLPSTVSCLNDLIDIFNKIAAAASNPFSMTGMFIQGILFKLIDSLLSTVCKGVLSVFKTGEKWAEEIANWASSQANICMPFSPKQWNFDSSLGLEKKVCKGTQVFGVSFKSDAVVQPDSDVQVGIKGAK